MPLDNIRSSMQARKPYQPPMAPARPNLLSMMEQYRRQPMSVPQAPKIQPGVFQNRAGMDVALDFNKPQPSPFYGAMMRGGK